MGIRFSQNNMRDSTMHMKREICTVRDKKVLEFVVRDCGSCLAVNVDG